MHKIKGFTLLELAIVLLIMGVVIAGGLTILVVSTKTQQVNATVARMDKIEVALLNYGIVFGRLPCPSDLTLPPANSNYGVEAANNGTCVGGTPAVNFSAMGGLVEGGIPTRALQLPDDYIYDAWGRRYRYVVDAATTLKGTLPVSAAASSCTEVSAALTIKDAAGGARSTGALYGLISHGANGHGGYSKNGIAFNAASNNVDEGINCSCDSAGVAATYTPNYVAKLASESSASALNSFDDIVTFKEGWQIQTSLAPLATSAAAPCAQDMFFVDTQNRVIRKISSTGIISTIAGSGGWGFGGDGGPATSAQFKSIHDVKADSIGNLYITDFDNVSVRKVNMTTGIISVYAGGSYGYSGDGGPATSAGLQVPVALALDSTDNLYISDSGNSTVRKVTPAGIISTVAGVGSSNYNGDGPATSRNLAFPGAIAVDSSDNLYIADIGNYIVRKVSGGNMTTIAGMPGATGFSGDGGPATSARINGGGGMAVDSNGDVYLADTNNFVIRKIVVGGNITTVAGTNSNGNSGDGGQATSAQLSHPQGVAFDSSGNMFISDENNHRIRKVSTSGVISVYAGTSGGYSGNGGAATSAQMNSPRGIAFAKGVAGKTNYAASAQGATAVGSSTYSSNYAASGANNGDRKPTGWAAGTGGWNDGTAATYPDWLEIDFSGSKTIDEIDVFTAQNDMANPVDPTPSLTFSVDGIVDFQVQYWDGASWSNVTGGSITNNNLVWNKFTFTALTTTKIRIYVTRTSGGTYDYSRIVEVEAWGQ